MRFTPFVSLMWAGPTELSSRHSRSYAQLNFFCERTFRIADGMLFMSATETKAGLSSYPTRTSLDSAGMLTRSLKRRLSAHIPEECPPYLHHISSLCFLS